jgi:hypothetical protein
MRLTPPYTLLYPFSTAAAVKFVNLLVITPTLSIATLLLIVTSINSPLLYARITAEAAPPKVAWVER